MLETILGVIHFVELYHGEYDRKRLVQQLHKTNPLDIYDESRILNPNLKGYKNYLYQIYRIYTNSSKTIYAAYKILTGGGIQYVKRKLGTLDRVFYGKSKSF